MSARARLLTQQSRRRESGPSRSSQPSQTVDTVPLTQLADDSDLPEYQPLSMPLNDLAVRSISEITHRASMLQGYERHLKQSLVMLTDAVGSINDAYTERQGQLQARIEARQQRGRQEPTELERTIQKSVDELTGPVDSLSTEIEESVRAVIDMQAELEDERQALAWVHTKLEARRNEDRFRHEQRARGAEARREERAEQRRLRREARAAERQAAREAAGEDADENDDDDDNDDNDDDEEVDDDSDDEETGEPVSAVGEFVSCRDDLAGKYAALSAYQKYATNNDYARFKQTWHYALYPDNEASLPDATHWFDEAGQPVPFNANGGANSPDTDEDLVVAREVISLKCPLSLVVMTEPYRSPACKHVFEREAIMQYLQNRPQRCPQTGCDKFLKLKDMELDHVMMRRIERANKIARNRVEDRAEEAEEEDQLDADRSAVAIISSSQAGPSEAVEVKTEQPTRRRRRR